MRIVSLLPSATEVVVALGLTENLVGISHQCTWPPAIQHLPRVTDNLLITDPSPREISLAVGQRQDQGLPIYVVNAERLGQLQPNFVLTQNACDVCAVPEEQALTTLAAVAPKAAVMTMGAQRLQDVLQAITDLGAALGVAVRAQQLVESMTTHLAAIGRRVAQRPRPRVFVVEWVEPIICAGQWVPDLVEVAGGESLLTGPGDPFRVVAWSDVVAAAPDVLVVTPCGSTLEETVRDAFLLSQRPGWRDLPAVQTGHVFLMDGTVSARHGPRTTAVAEAFARLFHPAAFEVSRGATPSGNFDGGFGDDFGNYGKARGGYFGNYFGDTRPPVQVVSWQDAYDELPIAPSPGGEPPTVTRQRGEPPVATPPRGEPPIGTAPDGDTP